MLLKTSVLIQWGFALVGTSMSASGKFSREFSEYCVKLGFTGEIRTDPVTRLLYSTDASIYQVEPLGVAFPRDRDDLQIAVQACAAQGIPVLARGSGSSLAGQAIGPALILDCARYLTAIHDLQLNDPASPASGGCALVEPGVILDNLNRAARALGLQFGPDPASSERATVGGSLANNATGAHSIQYGMAADHLQAAQVILSDGSLVHWQEESLEHLAQRAEQQTEKPDRAAAIDRAALHIRDQYGDLIRERWPRTWRRASGYSLNYLLPWSASTPPHWEYPTYPDLKAGYINLAHLLAGSEGTLGILSLATVRLVPLPRHTVLGVLHYASVPEACDAVVDLLASGPSAIELIPQTIIRAARSLPAYASLLDWVQGDQQALLVVEFSGDDPDRLSQQARALGDKVLIAETAADQKKIWAVRKVGLGLLNARHGQPKPVAFIEDLAVPVERLAEFVRSMESILQAYGTTAEIYAHASAGCLHIRPILDMKQPAGTASMRAIAQEAVRLTVQLGGSVSGEHGDGLARSEWLEALFGEELMDAMRTLKSAADPHNLLNPGKIVAAGESKPPRMDATLRYGSQYTASSWQPVFAYSNQVNLHEAIEQCNGAAVCRKDTGVMCPSFQATQDEMHSTRGRANLLRAMISGRLPTQQMAEKAVYEAIDLCLACKGCKAECPSAVDMAKLRYEFLAYYYSRESASHARHRVRDYLFAYIGTIAGFVWPIAPLANKVLGSRWFASLADSYLGLAQQRKLPNFHIPLRLQQINHRRSQEKPVEKVFFLSDAFTEYFQPWVGQAALAVLRAAGCDVIRLPVIGAGRTLISKGFLKPARSHAARLVKAIVQRDPGSEIPIVGVEPSEIYTLMDEYLDLLPEQSAIKHIAARSWMIDEYLIRPGKDGVRRIERAIMPKSELLNPGEPVLLHGHCDQKARPPAEDGFPTGVEASQALLEQCGYRVQVIDSGCCGMAGAFGYETEHFLISQQISELKLIPEIRKHLETQQGVIQVSSAGVSCETQIGERLNIKVHHPVNLVWNILNKDELGANR